MDHARLSSPHEYPAGPGPRLLRYAVSAWYTKRRRLTHTSERKAISCVK
jgi:hypothetical protein